MIRQQTGRLAALSALTAALLTTTTAPATAADDTPEIKGIKGGATFNSARPVKAGTLNGETIIGDHYFYRIDLKPGQTLSVTAHTTVPRDYDPGDEVESLGVALYDPVRNALRCKGDSAGGLVWNGVNKMRQGEDVTADCSVGDQDDNDDPTELGGTYYIQAGITSKNDSRGTTLPLRLTIKTGDGIAPEPAKPFEPGKPEAPIPSQEASAPPADTDRDDTGSGGDDAQPAASTSPTDWAIPAATALTAAAAAFALFAVLANRRRRSTKTSVPVRSGPPPMPTAAAMAASHEAAVPSTPVATPHQSAPSPAASGAASHVWHYVPDSSQPCLCPREACGAVIPGNVSPSCPQPGGVGPPPYVAHSADECPAAREPASPK